MSYLNLLIPELEKRKEYLERVLAFTQEQLKNKPVGKLRISKNRGIPRYYHITEAKDTRGKYIPKEKQEIAQKLAEKDYLNKLMKATEAELRDINNYLKNHKAMDLEDIYTSTNDYRKNLIIPLVLPDELYAKQWKNELYETNPSYPNQKVYQTKNNEFVRSKSEVLLADMYYDFGIPYRYEAVVRLKNGMKKYPDFTLLDLKNRKIIYHEHLGMLDDDDYRKSNLRKLDEYRRNGIYPGKNLIITYEADGSPFNIKDIRQMIKEIFCLSEN